MRRVLLALVSTVAGLVLLLGFKTHGAATLPVSSSALSTPHAGSPGSTPGSTPGTTRGGSPTVTGDAVDTPYGPVQVQVNLSGAKIVDVRVLQAPMNTPRDQAINSYALPQLIQATMAANSANIDMVSGATYTSEGYLQSLQSALNRAGQ